MKHNIYYVFYILGNEISVGSDKNQRLSP